MSLVAVHTPIEICEADKKEIFYTKIDSILDQCPRQDTLIVFGDFNAVTGTERELYVGLHGSGTRNTNSCFLNLAKSKSLRIAGSWFQETRAAPLDLL